MKLLSVLPVILSFTIVSCYAVKNLKQTITFPVVFFDMAGFVAKKPENQRHLYPPTIMGVIQCDEDDQRVLVYGVSGDGIIDLTEGVENFFFPESSYDNRLMDKLVAAKKRGMTFKQHKKPLTREQIATFKELAEACYQLDQGSVDTLPERKKPCPLKEISHDFNHERKVWLKSLNHQEAPTAPHH